MTNEVMRRRDQLANVVKHLLVREWDQAHALVDVIDTLISARISEALLKEEE